MDIDFCPESRHRLYSGELDVRIFPLRGDDCAEADETILLPLTLTVTVTGELSCTRDSPAGSDWILDRHLQDIRFLPAATDGWTSAKSNPVRSHFRLARRGKCCMRAPLSKDTVIFRSCFGSSRRRERKRNPSPPPPARMKYSVDESIAFRSIKVKPPLGCITASHQIIVVQFDSTDLPEGVHKEEWKVACNTAESYYAKMIVTAHVENPAILVGNDNKCKFEPTLPGATSRAIVPIRNPTMLTLK